MTASPGAGRPARASSAGSAPPGPRAGADERCEMCAEPIGEQHQHVVDLDSRALMCTCRPCYLLFTAEDAELRYRAVPDRYLSFPDVALDAGQWDELEIPVGLAFFFDNSVLGRTVAFYPGPAGATESELPLGAWDRVVDAHPALRTLAPDVEALIVRMPDRTAPDGACFLVPIDGCYELVGALRRVWRGFDGGQEARALLDAFFAELAARSRPARRARPARWLSCRSPSSTSSPSRTPRRRTCWPGSGSRRPPGSGCTRWRCGRRCGSSRSAGATTTPRSGRCSTCSATAPAWPRRSSRSPGCTPRPWCRASPESTEIDLPLPCTYDFEVAGTKYLHALRDGDIPLLFLFSGTVFTRGTTGFSVAQVPWDREARYRLPVAVWRDLMEAYFPGTRVAAHAPRHRRGARALPAGPRASPPGTTRSPRCSPRRGRPGSCRDARPGPARRRRRPLRGLPALPLPVHAAKNQVRWQFGVLGPAGRGRRRAGGGGRPRRRVPAAPGGRARRG